MLCWPSAVSRQIELRAENSWNAYRSGETSLNSSEFAGFTCDRNEAVNTNCPTQLEKLEHGPLVSVAEGEPGFVLVPSQERVEGKICEEYAVYKLDNTRKHNKYEIRVDELEARGCLLLVCIPKRQKRIRRRRGCLLGCWF